MGHQRLHNLKVKDCDRDNCEHCGLDYWNTVDIKELGTLRCKVHCDPCIEAERALDRIYSVMKATEEKKQMLKRSEKNQREEFDALLKRQRAKMKVVLDNIRNFTQEQRHSEPNPEPQGIQSRMPYKE